jgi:hypothetical protein
VARFVIRAKAKAAGDVRFKVELTSKELNSGPITEEESTTLYSDLDTLRARGLGRE